MDFQNNISEIKRRTDIKEIISESVALRNLGNRYVGLCPFHSEKTPSFFVDIINRRFKCFGCGTSGDVFSFLKKHKGISFLDAIKFLGKKVGVVLNVSNEKNSATEVALIANQTLQDYFARSFFDSEKAKHYIIKKRGFSWKAIDFWGIGFCGGNAAEIKKQVMDLGINEDILFKLGILKIGNFGSYCTFANRIIFPIRDTDNSILGFAGRVFDESASKVKYINSNSSLIFSKGKVLYGLRESLGVSKKKLPVVIVEGYLDAVAIRGIGFPSVATCGVFITENQVSNLAKYFKSAILCFDEDEAGKRAKKRALLSLLSFGFEVYNVSLSMKDPASFYASRKKEELFLCLKNRSDAVVDLIRSASKATDSNFFSKRRRIKQLLKYLAQVKDSLLLSFYVKEIAFLFKEREDTLFFELKNFISEDCSKKNSNEFFIELFSKREDFCDAISEKEELVIVALINSPRLVRLIAHIRNKFSDSVLNSLIFDIVNLFHLALKHPEPDDIYSVASSDALIGNPFFLKIMSSAAIKGEFVSKPNSEKIILDWIKGCLLAKQGAILDINEENIRKAEKDGDMDCVCKLLKEQSMIIKNSPRF